MKIKQRKRTVVIKNLRSAYISNQKTKSVYFKLRPLPPLSCATAEYCLYIFLFLGSERGPWHSGPPPYVVRGCVLLEVRLPFDNIFCVGEGGVQSTLFCIFTHCYFISCPNKLKICHTIKQLYINNIMAKHENNALQKKFCNQFKRILFCLMCPMPGTHLT